MKLYTTNKSKILALTAVAVASAVLIGCSSDGYKSIVMTAKKDGDITVPYDYRSWPKFVSTIDKTKTRQVREIDINKAGMSANRGDAFPSGTFSIMEIYAAQKNLRLIWLKAPMENSSKVSYPRYL